MSSSRSKWKFRYLPRKYPMPGGKTWLRDVSIPFKLNKTKIAVYNGYKFIRSLVNFQRVGYKFGEFTYTRKANYVRKKVKKGKK